MDAPFYRPEVLLNSVTDIDPDFHRGAFDYLANTLQVAGKSFADICQTNAEVRMSQSSAEKPTDSVSSSCAGVLLRGKARCESVVGDAEDMAGR